MVRFYMIFSFEFNISNSVYLQTTCDKSQTDNAFYLLLVLYISFSKTKIKIAESGYNVARLFVTVQLALISLSAMHCCSVLCVADQSEASPQIVLFLLVEIESECD